VVIALRIWAIHLTRKSLQLHDYFVIIAHVREPSSPLLRFCDGQC
jgi:hypothetical protein